MQAICHRTTSAAGAPSASKGDPRTVALRRKPADNSCRWSLIRRRGGQAVSCKLSATGGSSAESFRGAGSDYYTQSAAGALEDESLLNLLRQRSTVEGDALGG